HECPGPEHGAVDADLRQSRIQLARRPPGAQQHEVPGGTCGADRVHRRLREGAVVSDDRAVDVEEHDATPLLQDHRAPVHPGCTGASGMYRPCSASMRAVVGPSTWRLTLAPPPCGTTECIIVES